MESLQFFCPVHPSCLSALYCSLEKVSICLRCLPNHRKHTIYTLEELAEIKNEGFSSLNSSFTRDTLSAMIDNYRSFLIANRAQLDKEIEKIEHFLKTLHSTQNFELSEFLTGSPSFEEIEKNLSALKIRKELEKDFAQLQSTYYELLESLKKTDFPLRSLGGGGALAYMYLPERIFLKFDVNKRKRGEVGVGGVGLGGLGGEQRASRFVLNGQKLYAINCMKDEKGRNYVFELNAFNCVRGIREISKCIKSYNDCSVLLFREQIYIFKKYCQIYDIASDKWTHLIELRDDNAMPAVALFNNRFIYVFHDNSKLEVLDLNQKQLSFSEVEVFESEYVGKSYAEAIQIDAENILVFGGRYF